MTVLQDLRTAPVLSDSEIEALLHSASPAPPALRAKTLPPRRLGDTPSRRMGTSTDFADIRAYAPGDEPRLIDWRASARYGQTMARSYHAELNQALYLVIDRGPSMRFGTHGRLKVAQAARIALWLAAGAIQAGHEVGLLSLDEPPQWLPPARTKRQLISLVKRLKQPCPPAKEERAETTWQHCFHFITRHASRGSKVVLLSDFIGLSLPQTTPRKAPESPPTAGEQYESEITNTRAARLLAHQFNATALQLRDASELALPRCRGLRLSWGGQQSSELSSSQWQYLQARQVQLEQAFRRLNITHRVITSDADAFAELTTLIWQQ